MFAHGSFNPHLVHRKPRDRGAARAAVTLARHVKSVQGVYGVIGAPAQITGSVLTTSDQFDTGGSAVYMQGPMAGPAGLYGTDNSGNPAVLLTPGTGLSIQSWVATDPNIIPPGVSAVSWVDSGYIPAEVVGVHLTGTFSVGVVTSKAMSPNGSYMARLYGYADDAAPANPATINSTGGASARCAVGDLSGVASRITILSDNAGNGIWEHGSVTAVGFNNISDAAQKEQVEDIGDEVVGRIHNLRPVEYRLRDAPEKLHYGLVAQDVFAALPEIVHARGVYDGDEQVGEGLSISLTSLVGLLVATVQQQEKRIAELESKQYLTVWKRALAGSTVEEVKGNARKELLYQLEERHFQRTLDGASTEDLEAHINDLRQMEVSDG